MSAYEDVEYQAKIDEEVALLKARREARRLVDAEERPAARPPEVLTLRERLARPREAVTYRIDGWQPAGSRVVLAAQFKAGKTTMVGNVVRVLVDGGMFLGRDQAAPVEGTVALLDFEMSGWQIDEWLSDQKISADDRVVVLPMRGAASAFDILDPDNRRQWAELLAEHGAAYLVLDCLRPVLDALALDEHRDAGRFLVAFDALLAEAGVGEALVVHHMGHTGERSRGDSRIRDWPDVEWRLVRQDEDPASPRYVSAYGRDVEQPEAQLSYDAATRRLGVVGGTRRDAPARKALDAVLALLAETPDLPGRQIREALADQFPDKAVRGALEAGTASGALAWQHGPRNSKLYRPGRQVPQGAKLPLPPVKSSVSEGASH